MVGVDNFWEKVVEILGQRGVGKIGGLDHQVLSVDGNGFVLGAALDLHDPPIQGIG